MSGIFRLEHRRSWAIGVLTVFVCAAAFGQPSTRISRSDSDLDSLNRLLQDQGIEGTRPDLRSNSILNQPSQVDPNKVDQRALASLMKEALDEANRLMRLLDADYARNPSLRPLVQQLLELRAQAQRLNDDLNARIPLQSILVSFRTLDSDWRLLSHRLSQVPRLGQETLRSVERLDRLDREVGKLFQVDPTLDRRTLLQQLAVQVNSLRTIIDELRLDATGGNRMAQLVTDSGKVQQQIGRVEQVVLSSGSYEQIVNEYNRFIRMWTVLLDQLRVLDNRYIERQIRYIVDANNSVHQLLWLEHTSNRPLLQQTATALMRSVDEFYNRTPLKLLLNVSNLSQAMQTANDFYGTVQNFKDQLDRNESDAMVLESYKDVEEYGYQFTRTFERLNSQAARVVLREIEDGIASLRSELNLAGTVSQVDYRRLLPLAASLENLADNMDFDIRIWLNSDRQSFREEALQASKVFMTRTRRLHQMLQGQPTLQELQRESSALYEDWRKVYQFLGYCRTSDRQNLASLAREINEGIYDVTAPLQLMPAR